MKSFIPLLPFIIFINFNSYADITTYPGKGDVFNTPLSGSINIQVSAQGNWVCSQPYTAGIVSTSNSSYSSSSYGTTSDGVFGLVYKPWPASDTVVTLNGTTTTNRTTSATGAGIVSNYQVSWINGKPSASSSYSECLTSYPWNLTPTYTSGSNRGSGSSTANLVATVHVGPKAIKGATYSPTLSNLRYYVRDATSGFNTAQLPNVTIVSPMTCSILPIAEVDFGIVNVTGKSNNEQLATSSTELTINCNSADSQTITTNITTSFSGNYINNNPTQLGILSSTNAVMGYIRGQYSTENGTCVSNPSKDVYFNNTNNKVLNNIGVGQTKIPISWSLCNNSAGLFGEGNAQATVNVSWD
ncbi:hypothetical protein ABN255_18780 [Providencia rettgeri]|uniref:hypothetical protein n=1 Tax=Providencia TaxID=586 RepID=UPI0018E43283|nr:MULTISPECIES: hypothetical protein [Providencia]MBI6194742.1 hypothetical protein [Providencia rettgeri]